METRLNLFFPKQWRICVICTEKKWEKNHFSKITHKLLNPRLAQDSVNDTLKSAFSTRQHSEAEKNRVFETTNKKNWPKPICWIAQWEKSRLHYKQIKKDPFESPLITKRRNQFKFKKKITKIWC